MYYKISYVCKDKLMISILVLPRIPWWTCDVSSQNTLNAPRELNFLLYKFNFTQLNLTLSS